MGSPYYLDFTVLNPEEVRQFQTSGRFYNAGPMEPVDAAGQPPLRRLQTDITSVDTAQDLYAGVVRIEDRWRPDATGAAQRQLFVSLETCLGNNGCGVTEAVTALDASQARMPQNDEAWALPLPADVGVRRVYVGDGDRNGMTDVLVVLDNGAGYVFHKHASQDAASEPAYSLR